MVVVNRRLSKYQKRLAKDDIALLIAILKANLMDYPAASYTRLELLIEKLKRINDK